MYSNEPGDSNWTPECSGHNSSMERCFLSVGVHGYRNCPLGAILSVRKTPERLCGLENVDQQLSVKRVKFQFGVYCLVKVEAEI